MDMDNKHLNSTHEHGFFLFFLVVFCLLQLSSIVITLARYSSHYTTYTSYLVIPISVVAAGGRTDV